MMDTETLDAPTNKLCYSSAIVWSVIATFGGVSLFGLALGAMFAIRWLI